MKYQILELILFYFQAKALYIVYSIDSTMKRSKPVVPANVDPVKLADEIKGNMATEWIKRREKIKAKPLLVQQS